MTIWMMIILMSIVTIIPRILPAFLVDKIKFPDWVGQWLELIPYAALGALIFPGIINIVSDQPLIGIVGGLVALLLAVFRLHIIFVVMGAVAVVYLML
ncbi:MAG TPA: AzlD domain-containing protein [Bacilli bacterium]|nr:AzlD domain-containing protein [Bacilli bacterium]